MMFAAVRKTDGSTQNIGAVDLTAPNAMQSLAERAHAATQGGPPRQAPLPAHGAPPPQPAATYAQVAPGTCHFRVPVRTNAGLQWHYRAIPCPPGVPPGLYVRVVQRR